MLSIIPASGQSLGPSSITSGWGFITQERKKERKKEEKEERAKNDIRLILTVCRWFNK